MNFEPNLTNASGDFNKLMEIPCIERMADNDCSDWEKMSLKFGNYEEIRRSAENERKGTKDECEGDDEAVIVEGNGMLNENQNVEYDETPPEILDQMGNRSPSTEMDIEKIRKLWEMTRKRKERLNENPDVEYAFTDPEISDQLENPSPGTEIDIEKIRKLWEITRKRKRVEEAIKSRPALPLDNLLENNDALDRTSLPRENFPQRPESEIRRIRAIWERMKYQKERESLPRPRDSYSERDDREEPTLSATDDAPEAENQPKSHIPPRLDAQQLRSLWKEFKANPVQTEDEATNTENTEMLDSVGNRHDFPTNFLQSIPEEARPSPPPQEPPEIGTLEDTKNLSLELTNQSNVSVQQQNPKISPTIRPDIESRRQQGLWDKIKHRTGKRKNYYESNVTYYYPKNKRGSENEGGEKFVPEGKLAKEKSDRPTAPRKSKSDSVLPRHAHFVRDVQESELTTTSKTKTIPENVNSKTR